MREIDLEPHQYRSGPLRGHPLANRVFLRAASICAVWFVLVSLFGRYVDHQLPWWCIALPAVAPGLLLAFIVISLDD